MRSNRKDLPVLAHKNSALDREEFKWHSKDHTNYVQWKDTKLVHVLSTALDPTEVREVSCKQKNGSSLKVPCPMPVVKYTRRIGGVDQADQHIGCYSVSRRSQRWRQRIFYYLVDLAIVNAHILHTSVHPDDNLNQLLFRASLFCALVANFSIRGKRSRAEVNYVQRRWVAPYHEETFWSSRCHPCHICGSPPACTAVIIPALLYVQH